MIATDAVIVKKKLTIKFGSQRIEAIPGTRTSDYGQHLSLVQKWQHSTSGNENMEMSKLHRSSDGKKLIASSHSKERSCMLASKKREAQKVIETPKEKRRKMDRCVTHQCSVILKSLRVHPAGWVFNQPVDPLKLNIPDYFSIISKPMDLGTIKNKLDRSLYSGTEEFVADVRLTFSNAMLYNPPENNVHKMAQELNGLFEMKWKALEEKWRSERSKVGLEKILSGRMMKVNDTRQNCPKTPPLRSTMSSKKSKMSEEKAARSSSCARSAEVEHPKLTQNLSSKLVVKDLNKGTIGGSRLACGIMTAKPPLSSVACKGCEKCGSTTCGCNFPSNSSQTSSDVTSERSLAGDLRCLSADASKLDSQAKSTSTSQMSKSDPDSDGAVSALDDGNLCPSSQITPPTTDFAPAEEWATPLVDVQMSPNKALRAAMLKSRFADTILKAQQRTVLDHGDRADPVKLQQEKERLERRQQEEKARIEARIKAAEAASRMKAEIELKKREKEREAARIALQKIERTVEIEHNLEILKELEMLSGCCLSPYLRNWENRLEVGTIAFKGAHPENPLERIGLFMKSDYFGDEDEEILNLNGDGEEGEFF